MRYVSQHIVLVLLLIITTRIYADNDTSSSTEEDTTTVSEPDTNTSSTSANSSIDSNGPSTATGDMSITPQALKPSKKSSTKGKNVFGDVDCSNKSVFLNSTPVNIADMEFYAKSLRNIDQLHHTDRCDPELDDKIHSKLWALEKDHVLTFGKLFELSCGMKKTCPGGRYMACDPTRKRCVCKLNSMWLPLTAKERLDPELNMNKGRCYLKVGSKCEDPRLVSTKKMEQLVCVENSYCAPIKEKGSGKTINQCYCPILYKYTFKNGTHIPKINESCWNAMFKQDVQLKALMKRSKEMKWKSFGEDCTSKNAIDTRIHTLRSIDVKLNREWTNEIDEKYHNGSSQRCNFAQNLNCGSDKKCVCKPFYSWNAKEKTCVGEEGAFCEMRFWGERNTIGFPTKCAEGLTCVVGTHPDSKALYHICCYIKDKKHLKTITYADYHMCEADDTGNDYYIDASVTPDPVEEILDDEDYYDDDYESSAEIVKFIVSVVPLYLIVVVLLK